MGGVNRLPMKDLAEIFLEAGCMNVRTWLQSGNVIFQVAPFEVRTIAESVFKKISSRFGFQVPIVTRTLTELEEVVAKNPFLKEKNDETGTLHVGFLKDLPDRSRVNSLSPDRSPPDRFLVVGREIFLDLPNGVARSKLTNQYFDSQLETVSTMRNWKTVLKLLETGSDR